MRQALKEENFVNGTSDNLPCRVKHYSSVTGSGKDSSEVLPSNKDMCSYNWLFQQKSQPHKMSLAAVLGLGAVEMLEGMWDPFISSRDLPSTERKP